VGFKRLDIAGDGLLDVAERLLAGVALADASPQFGDVGGVATFLLGFKDYVEVAGRFHAFRYARPWYR